MQKTSQLGGGTITAYIGWDPAQQAMTVSFAIEKENPVVLNGVPMHGGIYYDIRGRISSVSIWRADKTFTEVPFGMKCRGVLVDFCNAWREQLIDNQQIVNQVKVESLRWQIKQTEKQIEEAEKQIEEANSQHARLMSELWQLRGGQ